MNDIRVLYQLRLNKMREYTSIRVEKSASHSSPVVSIYVWLKAGAGDAKTLKTRLY